MIGSSAFFIVIAGILAGQDPRRVFFYKSKPNSKVSFDSKVYVMKFDCSWILKGGKVLYVRPKHDIVDSDWGDFFRDKLADFEEKELFLLVDVVGIEEKIGFEGFSNIIEEFQSRGIIRARIAVLPSNQAYTFLMQLFSKIATAVSFDLELEIFSDRKLAENWLTKG